MERHLMFMGWKTSELVIQLKPIYRFHTILIQIPIALFLNKNRQLVPEFIQKFKGPKTARTNLKNKHKSWRTHIS